MRRLLVCLLVGVMLVLLIAPRSSVADSDPNLLVSILEGQGLEFGQVVDDNGQVRFSDEIAQRIARAGASWVHVNFRLGGFKDWTETDTFGYSALSLYDEVVATAHRHGLEVVGLLSNEAWHGATDNWQANSVEAGGGNGGNTYLAEFVHDAAVVLARHFDGRVELWEIWNEPNATVTYLYPSNFAWLLANAYVEVKAAGVASVRFISGGLSSKQDAGGNTTAGSTGTAYLSATYAQGKAHAGWEEIRAAHGSYPLDAIGQHIYVDGYERTDRGTVRTTLQLVRDAYLAGEGGDGAKQTIVTEMGWASDNVSERVQADNLQLAFAEITQTPYVQAASWFFLRDEPSAGLAFGLLRPDGAEKLAWHAYRIITVPGTPPLAPSGVHATGFETAIRIEWHENVAPKLAGYIVARALDPNGPFAPVTEAPIAVPAYVDAEAPAGVPVYYRITAIDTDGNVSAESRPVAAMLGDADSLEPFERTWARTDLPVADSRVERTWIWGSEPFTAVLTERYDESPNGFRQAQYFDKSRMELTHPDEDEDADWFVTNGLLVVELVTGWMQVGDDAYIEREPANVNVAGDPDSGPTYAVLRPLRWAGPRQEDSVITARLAADGTVTADPGLADRDVRAARYVPETRHTVAAPFWAFMNAEGLVDVDGEEAVDSLFIDPFYATGFPITEAYWTLVEVNGVETDVLIQCFQRRCLTYTPDNDPAWQVEAGNVGLHYFEWRYRHVSAH